MRIPIATYRLQFGPSFRFEDAKKLIAYLADLGVSDVYASPILKATKGSTHGYDVTSPTELNPELGTRSDFEALAEERHAYHIGWLQDIVPNHMAYSSENEMLMDVFEHGPRSRYSGFFDVFRDHPDPELQRKILAPVLGRPLAEALADGEVRLVWDENGLAARYYDWRFPLRPASYEKVLLHDLERTRRDLADAEAAVGPFAAMCHVFTALDRSEWSDGKRQEIQQAKAALDALYRENDGIRTHVDRALAFYNQGAQNQDSPLAALLEQQHVKLAFWQRAREEINYRRFFYLNDFIALRIEDDDVFETTHKLILELVQAGLITGLRIDHIDGLYHPRAYLNRLRERAPNTYVIAEKILELEESLPTDWSLEGTSGYRFCNYTNAIFCASENQSPLTDIYHEFLGTEVDRRKLLFDAKKQILSEHMSGEIAYLAHLFGKATESTAGASLDDALTALIAAFPVYRTYIDDENFSAQDREYVTKAVEKAREFEPSARAEIVRIGDLLLAYPNFADRVSQPQDARHFVMRFQQFTGPAMAKGFEDTMLYAYNRFVSLNEVGGDPDAIGIELDRFHDFNRARARNWPHAMNATSTHDAKRGEDVRARLNVLSEMPARWRDAVTRWRQMNEVHKGTDDGRPAPDSNDEYLLYQTLVGAVPFDRDRYDDFTGRVKEYMVKVVREAKRHSTWVRPNEGYEGACLAFIDRICDRGPDNPFWQHFLRFQKEIAEYGIANSLSQTLLKMTCPGVPDFYRGAELWDLNLVDPDNRRPVDFEKRMRFLHQIQATDAPAQLIPTLIASRQDGRVKLFLIQRVLQARRQNEALFRNGDYIPATVTGSLSRHIIAFFRLYEGKYALVVAPRFCTVLVRPGEFPVGGQIWKDTKIGLPAGASASWYDVITDETQSAEGTLLVGDILSTFPAGLLLGEAG